MVRGRENVPFPLDGFVEPCEVTADAHAAVWFWHNDHAGTPIRRFGHWANDASVFHATEGFNNLRLHGQSNSPRSGERVWRSLIAKLNGVERTKGT